MTVLTVTERYATFPSPGADDVIVFRHFSKQCVCACRQQTGAFLFSLAPVQGARYSQCGTREAIQTNPKYY